MCTGDLNQALKPDYCAHLPIFFDISFLLCSSLNFAHSKLQFPFYCLTLPALGVFLAASSIQSFSRCSSLS